MKKFPIIMIAATIIIFITGILLFSRNQNSSNNDVPPLPTSHEYFWGDGCPHCTNVEEFLTTWERKDKINIDKKEVWKNKANAKLMSQRATYCELDKKKLGVPFLFTPEGICISGDEPIIEYFKSLQL